MRSVYRGMGSSPPTDFLTSTDNFLEGLDRLAMRVPVSVCVVPAEDAQQLQSSAKETGFCAAVVGSEKGAAKNDVFLVIGTDDAAVDEVCKRITGATPGRSPNRQGYGWTSVIGGALIGAAAVFAGLAA